MRDVEKEKILRILVEKVLNKGDKVDLLEIVKNKMMRMGGERIERRIEGEKMEIVDLRGGKGRDGIIEMNELLERRMKEREEKKWKKEWKKKVKKDMIEEERGMCKRMQEEVEKIDKFVKEKRRKDIGEIEREKVEEMEKMESEEKGRVEEFYQGERGEKIE